MLRARTIDKSKIKIAFVYMNTYPSVGHGAGYVTGAILHAGYGLKFYDTSFISPEAVAKNIIKENFDLLIISSMTMLFSDALKIIRAVKKKKNIPTLMGGVHSTIIGSKLLEEHEEIDYLCIGEGESMVIDFLQNFNKDSLYDVKNLAYRRNGRVYTNQIRNAEELSKLPPFPWHLFHKNAVVEENTGFLNVTATRGCPYNCTYCCNGIYLKHYGKDYLRFRPIADVIEELKYLYKRYNPHLFFFGDEMILSNPDYAVELFQAIKHELNVPYGCMVRVEHINQKIVDIFQMTGCKYIAIGIECGSEEFRKRYLNRRMTNDEIEKAFSLVKKAGIFTTSFNMIGYPFENDEFLTDETVKLNLKIKPDYAQFTIFYPFPATKLYERCIELNLLDPLKLINTKDYHTESVLKGVSLRKKREEINRLLNPHGMQFSNGNDKRLLSHFIRLLQRNKLVQAVAAKLPNSFKNLIKKNIVLIYRCCLKIE